MDTVSDTPCCSDRRLGWLRAGWSRGEPPPPRRGTPLAVQSERRSPPPHPEAEAPGDQLGLVRRRPARPRQPHRVVRAGGGRRVEGRAAHRPGRATLVFGPSVTALRKSTPLSADPVAELSLLSGVGAGPPADGVRGGAGRPIWRSAVVLA